MKKLMLLFFVIYAVAMPYNEKMLKQIQALKNENSFSFVVMGDNRDGDNVLKKIIAKNNKSDVKFLINNGDLVPDGYVGEFDNYLKIIKTSKKPIISVIGNHEIPWYDGETNYERTFGKTNFSFIFGNSYFIILDTSNEKITKESFKWLKKQLQISQSYQNRFVFTHVPLYDPREGKYKKGHSLKKLKQVKKLNELLDKYNVTMIFCSHIHSYFKGYWHKTPYIITGGAGAPLKKNGFYHYIKVIVNRNNVEYKVIKIKAKKPSFIEENIKEIKEMF